MDRYPLDPLAHRLGITLHQPGRTGPQDHRYRSEHPAGWTALADRLGVSVHHLRHVARIGLTDRQADRWSIRCGLMPQQVWDGQWWDQAPDEGDDWYSDDPPLAACTPTLQRIIG